MTTHYGQDALAVLTSNAPNYEHLDEGEQGKYNHTDCPSGVDTKQRLYVKNLDGAYLWHCHNCGDSGYYRPRETVSRIKEETSTVVIRGKLPTYDEMVAERNFDKFKIEGQLWLSSYGFSKSMCGGYYIGEIETGIMLPIYNNMRVVGFQVRRYTMKPKYLTYSKQRYSHLPHTSSNPLVVVEDLLSSYKLHMAGYSTLCLLGTKMDAAARKIAAEHKRVVLWLDDDEAGHKAATKLFRELGPLCPELTTIFMKQPKEIELDVLREMEL